MKNPGFSFARGFTLIELLVVVSIIGMLSSVILVSLTAARAKGIIGAGQTFDSYIYHAFGANAAAMWAFNEGSGSSAADSSVNSNTLTINGSATWLTSQNAFQGASGIDFPGAGGYLINSSFKGFDPTNGSISFWIFLRSVATAQTPVAVGSGGSGNGLAIRIVDWVGNLLTVLSGVNSGVASNLSTLSPSSILNKWTHIIISWNGSSIKAYINGTQVGAANNYSSAYPSSSITIGAESNGSYLPVNAKIDEVRVYTQSLQTAQIEKLYAEGAAKHGIALGK